MQSGSMAYQYHACTGIAQCCMQCTTTGHDISVSEQEVVQILT